LADLEQETPHVDLVPQEAGLRLWTASAGAPSIEFSVALVEEIRTEVVRAMHGLGRGGIEVGGLLIGTFEDDNYVVDTWRLIRCDHSRGSSFLLSDRDVATLSCQIEATQVDPILEGRRVLGWFVSHTRGGLETRIEESQLHMRHFDTPGSLLLTVQPTRFGDAQAAIHVFEPGEPPSLPPLDPPLPILPAPGVRSSSRAPQPAPAPKLPWLDEATEPAKRRSFGRRWLPWMAGAAGLAFLVLGIFSVRAQKRAAGELLARSGPVHVEPSGPPEPLLSVHLEKAEDSIQVSWDASSPAVAGARSGVLTVLDQGAVFSRKLTPGELKLGRIDYTRSQGEIHVRLSVDTASRRISEEAHYEPSRFPDQFR